VTTPEGILLVDKPIGKTSFSLVSALRRHLGVKKIGHAGTLDPMATGVMVMLIGKNYTRRSDHFMCTHKEYVADITFGYATDTYDQEGQITDTSPHIPSLEQIETALKQFEGSILQTPPMYSAKKVDGQKLCDLARKGKSVERAPCPVTITTHIRSYSEPTLRLWIRCSKGTYIRSLAHDLGLALNTFATLTALRRVASGSFQEKDCYDGAKLFDRSLDLRQDITSNLQLIP
jgi:tRNA pseudouridine55 synthase